MKKNLLWKTTLMVVFPMFGTFSVVSCQKEDEKYLKESDQLPSYEGIIKHIDATIISWADGDTVTIDAGTGQLVEGRQRIRLVGIDTPEKGLNKDGVYVESEGEEKLMAEQATNFAKELLPAGTKVKFVFSGRRPAQSYERIVGWIFYEDPQDSGKWKNYSAEIIRQGLTAPNLADWKEKMSDISQVEYYEAIKLWNAFYEAWNNNRGMYKNAKNQQELISQFEKYYGERGVPSHLGFYKETEDNILEKQKFIIDLIEEEKKSQGENK
ncbi:thermonuclease family protein [Mesomycoplasma lagogenitalium]|uniref:Thermonuclease family protein n=1 Tax=Mesomycoplasma lagogenitalium TaxID=171286 RepID=A0ABY8LW47_9BACT|nr:thermonuclease family protein [Mesomycoplasma lagogenitalium]WGI36763.1 thermonuclease family protein [Mesomycoplasma lagogenitalium]